MPGTALLDRLEMALIMDHEGMRALHESERALCMLQMALIHRQRRDYTQAGEMLLGAAEIICHSTGKIPDSYSDMMVWCYLALTQHHLDRLHDDQAVASFELALSYMTPLRRLAARIWWAARLHSPWWREIVR